MLGRCKAWVLANETQARGSLHMHILVWGVACMNLLQRMTEVVRSFSLSGGISVTPVSLANQAVSMSANSDRPAASPSAVAVPVSVAGGDHMDRKHSVCRESEPASVDPVMDRIRQLSVSDAQDVKSGINKRVEHQQVEQKLADFLNTACTAELSIADVLVKQLHECGTVDCNGKLVASSNTILNQLK